MYSSGYTTTATALRAKSSFYYAPLPFYPDDRREGYASCAQSFLHGFSVNPRFLLYGYWSRQSALIYWSPSRSFLARQVAARCRLSALRDLGLGPSCRRCSDERCREMIGLLTEVRSCCCRENYGAGKSRNEDGCDKVGSLVKNLKREVEIESVDGESRRPFRARKDGSSLARYSESSLDLYSGSERKGGKGRRTAYDSSRERGRGNVAEREVREYKDDAGSKRRDVSECDAGRDSVKKSVFRAKDDNLKVKAASLWSSHRETWEDYGYEGQNVAKKEGYRRFTRMSEVDEDDARRSLSSKNMAVPRKVSREESSSSKGKWHGKADQRVVGRAGWKLEDKEEKGASWMDRREKGDLPIDLAHEAREEYGFEDELIVRKRESREGSWKATGTSDSCENDAKKASSSKNMVDERRAGWEVSSTSNKHTDLGQRVVGRTELERRSQKSWEMTEVHDSNIESASNSHNHYEETRVREREDRYDLAQHLVHASKDKRSQLDRQVGGTMESSKHHESCSDVSRVHTGDAETLGSSQRLLEATKDGREDYLASAMMNLVGEAWDPWNPINEPFTHQSSSRRESERNTQIFEVSRSDSDTERIFNSQEIYNAGIENEHVNHPYRSRRESGKETNISESSRNDNERVSNSQEISNTNVEHRRGDSSLTMVQDKIEQQRSNLSGESSRPTKRQMENTGSFECGTTSLNTFTHELDDQTSRGEMHIIKNSLLESAGQSDKSSGLYIGEFVDKLQLELTSLDGLDYASKYSPGIQIEEIPSWTSHATTRIQSSLPASVSEYKGGRYVQEGARTSASRTGTKGPSDEMWDVRGLTSQKTYRAEEAEEGPIAAEVVDSTTVTEGTENPVAQRSHRSLWTYVADIIKLSWGPHAESPNPTLKYGARSSSNGSVSSEAWFSGKEPDDDDEISKKSSGISKESLLIKRPVDESDPRRHAGPSQGRSEVPKFRNRLAMSEAGASTSMGITKAGSLAQGFSRQEVGWTEGEKGRKTIPSNIITVEQSSALTDDTTPAIIEEEITNIGNAQMPVGRYTKLEEKLVGEESPEGKDGELKRRKLQRNKQVLKERFDEWEEAYRLESEQRKTDEFFMRESLGEAQKAADTWEVPVGAVLVQNGKIIARGRNLVEELRDSTAHAEMICIREASNLLQTWRLAETTLYVTLEPCPMCAGGILQARIDTVVWGAPNKLLGADGSWVRLFPGDGGSSSLDPPNQTAGPVHPFHPKITVRRGVLATECSEVMQQFFQLRRKKIKKPEASPPGPPKFLTKIHDMFSAMFCLQHLN